MARVHQPSQRIRDRAEWILRFMYAPDGYGRHNQPVYGKTRLMKACFLMDRKLEEKFDVETGFKFEPHRYGPFDKGVYDAVDYLRSEDLLDVTEPEEHDDDYDLIKYHLTSQGEVEAEQEYNEISIKQQELIKWVKNEHALKKLGKLITYVYNEYPKMTEESELA